MNAAYLCDALRTPIGRYGGSLAQVRADDLAALPLRALIARHPQLDWAAVDDLVYGCANQAGEDNRNVARMAALLAGLPTCVSGTTINRLCGSGLDAVGQAARAIKCGEASLMLAGGTESMSRAPFVMAKAETAYSRRAEIYDSTIGWRFVNSQMARLYGTDSMPETADNIAAEFNISRADQDSFAWRSQQRCQAAQAAGYFAEEIVPVELPGKKGELKRFASDEHPRPETSLAQLGQLQGINGAELSVTAGNSSGINDGACALLLASERALRDHGLIPRARVLGMATAGVAPRLMGFGPAPAVKKLLAQTGLSMAQMAVIELNEAFAAQALAVARELGLADDDPRLNPQGGAIALGHPLGMSGARLVTTAMLQLARANGRYALCTMCIGVGQGIALIIEKI